MRGGIRRRPFEAMLALALLLAAPHLIAQSPPAAPTFRVDRFEVDGDNPLSAERTNAVLGDYVGAQSGVDGLLAAADALEAELRDRGFSFYRVILPPQTLEGGTVRLEVKAFELSSVTVRGNEHFSQENVLASVPSLRTGAVPSTRALYRDLDLANANPSKQIAVRFRESDTVPETLEADVQVEDRLPYSAFATLNNTGTASTGPLRMGIGAQATNLFDRDHTLLVNYVTSPGHAAQVKQAAVAYRIPLYGHGGSISAYYVRSDVDTGTVLNTFDVSGRGRFAGISYEHVLPRWNGVHHRVTVALDDKLFDNQIVAFGANLGVDARSRPVTLGYSGEYAGDGWSTTFRASYSRNTMSGGGNKGAAYRANRAGADTHWDVFRGGLTFDVLLPAEWALRAIFDGQLANEELIPGEQFGLGGASSVRGFDERQISGDDGVRGSFELWAPPPAGTDLRFLFFVDTGSVKLKRPNPGITSRDALASTGVGVRWQYKDRVAVSLDVGKVLEGTARRDEDARGHLNVLVRY